VFSPVILSFFVDTCTHICCSYLFRPIAENPYLRVDADEAPDEETGAGLPISDGQQLTSRAPSEVQMNEMT